MGDENRGTVNDVNISRYPHVISKFLTLLTVLRRWSWCDSCLFGCFVFFFLLRGVLCCHALFFACFFFFFFVFSVLFSTVITSLVEERAGLCASRAYVFIFYFLFFCLFSLHASISVLFLFLLVSGIDCGLWLWHSLEFSINFFQLCLFVN